MKYGLTETTVEKICAVFARFPEIEKAILYGSRAKGNFKTGSDIDLTLCGEALTSDLCSTIASALDDLLLPYTIDLSVFNELNHAKLREHIERVGVPFYERANHGGVMKKGWEVKELGAVSTISYGYTESANSEPVGPRFLRITDIQDDRVDWQNVPYCKIESADLPKYRLATGDIVFARTGATTGKSFLVNDPPDAVFASYLIRLRLLDKKLLPEFLSLFFQTAGYWKSIKDGSAGSAQGGFNATKLAALSIPIPPFSEQRRIVGILDEAFEGIATAKANAEKNLQNARALFESHLQSVFTQRGEGWVEKTLGDVFTTATGTTPPKNNADFYGDFMPLVKPPELCDAPFDSAADGLSEAGVAVARTLPSKSILVSCIGNLGKIGLNTIPVAFNQQINAILPDESQAIPEFMFFQSLSSVFKEQLQSLASGTTVPIVNKSKFNSIKVILPPLPCQKPVVAQLGSLREETQHLESIYQQKLTALEALKKSLLHQAFTGNL